LRGPRRGVTKPCAISPLMTAREMPSIDWMPRNV
jgi:hypothetical protein